MMKKFLYVVAILAIILSANCSRIDENNDPVIGVWLQDLTETDGTARMQVQREWIFNDVFLGRYHERQNGTLTIVTDFSWSKQEEVYTVTYNGLENKPQDQLILKTSKNGDQLHHMNGSLLAKKE
ncbi:hypothetical protein [Maribacter sp. 2307ULW6-5]|uniref:hypothetical protein n=1 Tax=Maribacter sp. 2307ULW6-5 TaxID=3386275 RepID=UPI0039BD4771